MQHLHSQFTKTHEKYKHTNFQLDPSNIQIGMPMKKINVVFDTLTAARVPHVPAGVP